MEASNQALSKEEEQRIEDAAFAAEMGGSEVDAKAPIDSEEQKEEVIAAQDAKEVAQEAEKLAGRVEVIPGFTQEEINELRERASQVPKLQKALDTTNGTYGSKIAELQQVINSLKAQQPATADGGVSQKITAESFKRLTETYPELARDLAQDLSEIIKPSSPGSQVPDEVLNQLREEFSGQLAQRDQEETQRAVRRLAKHHPDYKEVAKFEVAQNGLIKWGNSGFGFWVSQQPDDVKNAVFNSKDPDELAEILTSYKDSTKPKEEIPQRPNKSSALSKAILPKSTAGGGRAMTEQEIEEAAYRAEMAS